MKGTPPRNDSLPQFQRNLAAVEALTLACRITIGRKKELTPRSNTNDNSTPQQNKDNKTKQPLKSSPYLIHSYKNCISPQQHPRIQIGLLSFTTQMSSFILKGTGPTPSKDTHFNPPFCAYLPIYTPDPRTGAKQALVMVGRLLVQGSEVVKLGPVNVAEFIVLSSTSRRMNPGKGIDEDDIPEIYDLQYFEDPKPASVQEPRFYNVMWSNYSP